MVLGWGGRRGCLFQSPKKAEKTRNQPGWEDGVGGGDGRRGQEEAVGVRAGQGLSDMAGRLLIPVRHGLCSVMGPRVLGPMCPSHPMSNSK